MRTKDAQHANLQSGRLSLAVAALGVCVALWQLAYYFPRTVDDMFIFLRYAENLGRGHGPVYNLGEPVEGFSSPLWTALLALGVAIGVHGVIWAKLLGFGAYAALALGIDAFARERLKLGRLTRAGAFALLACNAYIASWTMYGLETPAYLALLAWTAVSLGRRMDAPTPRNGVALALCASALCLSRPEAPLYLLALGFALALEPLRLGAVRARVDPQRRARAGGDRALRRVRRAAGAHLRAALPAHLLREARQRLQHRVLGAALGAGREHARGRPAGVRSARFALARRAPDRHRRRPSEPRPRRRVRDGALLRREGHPGLDAQRPAPAPALGLRAARAPRADRADGRLSARRRARRGPRARHRRRPHGRRAPPRRLALLAEGLPHPRPRRALGAAQDPGALARRAAGAAR